MSILVVDTNVFNDMATGELIEYLFLMEEVMVTPDVLYREELGHMHPRLIDLGLRIESISSDTAMEVERLHEVHKEPSRNDIRALALAKNNHWTLLTGDEALRKAAEAESVKYHGTIWLIEQMVRHQIISVLQAEIAFTLMQVGDRFLPYDAANQMLDRFRVSPPQGGIQEPVPSYLGKLAA